MRNNVAACRKGKFSQAELAQAAGITRPYLSDIERGISNPTSGVVRRICQALGKSFEEVFCGEPDPQDKGVPARAV